MKNKAICLFLSGHFCIFKARQRAGGPKAVFLYPPTRNSEAGSYGNAAFLLIGVKMKKTVQPVQKAENADVAAAGPLAATGVEKMILVIRDKQVLLDRDLATLYGVETRAINQAVKRNLERFPERNCFQLTKDELPISLKLQIVILNDRGNKRGLHIKKMPFAFTEQGVAMLASVLHSETAVRVSLQIMDAFVSMRHFLMHNGGIVNRLVRVESKEVEQDRRLLEHDQKIDSLFEAMDRRETDLQKVMENFIDPSTYKHFLILNGRKLEADVAYAQIYGMAKGTARCSRNCGRRVKNEE